MDLADGVVLVLSADGVPHGTGFAVSDTLLVTCAHVVEQGGAAASGERRPGSVTVIFHATGDMRETRVGAEAVPVAEWWRASDAEDIALLRVERMPSGVKILPLGSVEGINQDEIQAFGYPDAGGIDGLRGDGRVVGQVKESGRPLLQLASKEITPGFSGGPVWDRRKRRVIGVVTSILAPDRFGRLGESAFATPTTTLRAICPDLEVSDICPYVSLNPFGADDAEFFFGRDRLVAELIAKLRSNPRFLALLGPSGSGKSSVIRAGLIPRLATGDVPGSRGWGTIIIRPGADPFAELQRAGLAGEALTESFGQWIQSNDHGRGVLVIDQFEELLATTSADLRAAFVAQLTGLLQSSLPVTVVLVMRNDFYGRLGDAEPPMLRWIERGLVNVLPLDRTELAEIITAPARKVGFDFDEGLAGVIVNEAMAMRSQAEHIPSTVLPLVEFTLTELWKQSHQQGRLTHEAYVALGGISGALTQWADGAYASLEKPERAIAQSIFLDLVHVADEEEMPDTRERRRLSELCTAISDRASVETVLNKLAARRLVITGENQATVELIHDALIREWEPLHSWVSQERPFRRWRQEIDPAVQAWAEYVRAGRAGEKPDWLRDRRLGQAEQWLENRGADLPPDLKSFIGESLQLRSEEAERERRQIIGEQERQQALRVSESLRLASEARQAAPREPDTAFLVAWEAMLQDQNELTESVFRETLGQLSAPVTILRRPGQHSGVSAGFLGRGIAVFTADLREGTVEVRQLHGTRSSRFEVEGSGTMAVAPVPQVGLLLTWRDQVLRLYREDGSMASEICLSEDRTPARSFHDPDLSVAPCGRCLVHHDARSWVVDIDPMSNDLRVLHSLTFRSDDFQAAIHPRGSSLFKVALNRDGNSILTEGSDAAGIWTVDGQLQAVLKTSRGAAAAGFLADGRVATGTMHGAGQIWDSSGHPLGEFKASNGTLDLFINAIDTGGDRFATSVNHSGVTEIWASTGELLATLPGHEDHVWSGAFASDGVYFASGGSDCNIQVYDWRQEEKEFDLKGHQATVNNLVFHPSDPRLLLSASQDGEVRLWTLEKDIFPPLRGHSKDISEIESTSVGIISSSRDDTCRIWRPDGHSTKVSGRLATWRGAPQPNITMLTNESASVTCVWQASSWGDVTKKAVIQANLGSGRGIGGQSVLSPDASQLILTYESKAELYSSSGELLGDLVGENPRKGRFSVTGCGFHPDGHTVFTAAENGTVWLWRSDGTLLRSFFADFDVPPKHPMLNQVAANESTPDVIKSLTLDPRGEFLLFGLREEVAFWTWDAQLSRQIRPAGYKVSTVVFAPDGSYFITVADRPSMVPGYCAQLWQRSGALIASLPDPDVSSSSEVKFDPQGRFFCLQSSPALRIFGRDGELLATLAAARGVYAVDTAISDDGRLVAVLFTDGTVRIWDSAAGRRTMTLEVGSATAICFNPETSRLLAASATGSIDQYALNIAELFPGAAARIGRNFKAEEIDRFGIEEPVRFELGNYRQSS